MEKTGASPAAPRCGAPGLGVERHDRFQTAEPQQVTCVQHCLAGTEGPVIAASDYMHFEPAQENPWDH